MSKHYPTNPLSSRQEMNLFDPGEDPEPSMGRVSSILGREHGRSLERPDNHRTGARYSIWYLDLSPVADDLWQAEEAESDKKYRPHHRFVDAIVSALTRNVGQYVAVVKGIPQYGHYSDSKKLDNLLGIEFDTLVLGILADAPSAVKVGFEPDPIMKTGIKRMPDFLINLNLVGNKYIFVQTSQTGETVRDNYMDGMLGDQPRTRSWIEGSRRAGLELVEYSVVNPGKNGIIAFPSDDHEKRTQFYNRSIHPALLSGAAVEAVDRCQDVLLFRSRESPNRVLRLYTGNNQVLKALSSLGISALPAAVDDLYAIIQSHTGIKPHQD